MKNNLSRVLAVSMTVIALALAAFAQNNSIASAAGDKYVISAKAGGVSFVEGTVSIIRKNGQSGRLIKGDQIEISDRVSVSADGKAEILLNPGSYLRLAGNSVFEFNTTSLDNLQLKLTSGSAILEVFAANEFRVVVNVPKVKYTLIESGVYRIDVTPEGSSRIAVWKGRAQVGNSAAGTVKSGREATVKNSELAIAKFDQDDKDSLEIWSKVRSKELAKTSASLGRAQMRTALMNSFLGRQWNMYDSFGLWVFDPFGRNYCFLPFGMGWNSPYGYGFGNYIGRYNLPPIVYYPPVTPPIPQNTDRRRTNPTAILTNPDSDRSARERPIPPFVRMQDDTSSRVGVPETRLPIYDTDRGPVSSPSIIAAPSIPSDPTGAKRRP